MQEEMIATQPSLIWSNLTQSNLGWCSQTSGDGGGGGRLHGGGGAGGHMQSGVLSSTADWAEVEKVLRHLHLHLSF